MLHEMVLYNAPTSLVKKLVNTRQVTLCARTLQFQLTALHIAVQSQTCNPEMVELLIEVSHQELMFVESNLG
jgi:hypothetical protein